MALIQKLGQWLSNTLVPLIAVIALLVSLWTCFNASSGFDQIDHKIDGIHSELQSLRDSPSSSLGNLSTRLVRLEGSIDMLLSESYQRTQFDRQITMLEQTIKDRQQIQFNNMHGGE
ncbi:hypothetical protein [Pseudomonas sp. MS15a(2019)]|uniref:hypothetical protein n=1 Tax=Pseudomonas sp. MS15a(2019) TaxID=2579938 RepID=UPI0015656358|nr:hypothetical protein [Pseudomonas sp. MS15a(2019)]NRH40648.1 hypothetical protein [Pseudomonas sp. MS15a(2019)]